METEHGNITNDRSSRRQEALSRPISQRDYVIQPRVARNEIFAERNVRSVVLVSPWVSSRRCPSTLKGLRPFSDFANGNEGFAWIPSLTTVPFQGFSRDSAKGIACMPPQIRVRVSQE